MEINWELLFCDFNALLPKSKLILTIFTMRIRKYPVCFVAIWPQILSISKKGFITYCHFFPVWFRPFVCWSPGNADHQAARYWWTLSGLDRRNGRAICQSGHLAAGKNCLLQCPLGQDRPGRTLRYAGTEHELPLLINCVGL